MAGVVSHMLGLNAQAAASNIFGALLTKSGDQTVVANTPTVVAWGAEGYDEGGWHDNVTNNSRATVPSGVSRVKFSTSTIISSGQITLLEALKNGSTVRGGYRGDSETTGNNVRCVSTAVLSVSAGDYLESRVTTPETTVPASNQAWACIEKIDPGLRACLVYKSSSQSISAGTTTTLTWDSEEYDDAAYHDNVTNNSRLTVPSGVSLVRVSACLKGGNVAGQMLITFLKNGASARGLPGADNDTSVEENMMAASAVLEVSAGDYFECQVFTTNATSITNDNEVWFCIEEIASSIKRACVYKTASQAISPLTDTILTWAAELYDTDAFHDNATNNSRLTIPSGCTKARLTFSVRCPGSTANQKLVRVLKNGANYSGMPLYECDTAGTDSLAAMGAWVDVTPGDYFEVEVNFTTADSVSTDDTSWFAIEAF